MASNPDELGDQMQAILDLMTKRSKGEATNQQVEAAASQIISVMGGSKPQSKEEDGASSKGSLKKRSICGPSDSSTFQADTGDYDDDDEEDDNHKIQQKQKEEPTKGNKRKPSEMPTEDEEDESYQDQIDQIKLGKQGAKMMTTFGDGPRPDPEALTTALLGTRKCLQVALFDARALRRHAKQTYEVARQSFAKRKMATSSDAVDPNMLYRAFSGYDKLSYDPKCGFDMEQLRHLFPEEMRAYMRWKDLHSAYQESSADEKNNAIQGEDGKEDNNEETITGPEQQDDPAVIGGHLQQRAAQFDHRTEKMKSDWYIKFAQVRQGSFLPRGMRHRKSEAESEWDKSRKTNRKRGAPVTGTWEIMSATQVQFLHWLGFQPPAMPPPNDETTQALAFLGYDFLGKIVEKAIFLRNLEILSRNQSQVDDAEVLGELRRGEQLTAGDIELAMDDPDIRPVPLHGVEKTSRPSVQLYFGPGFEERLELELEELVAAGKPDHISEEERLIRQKESALFAELANPPEVLDSVSHLMECNKKAADQQHEEEEEEITPSKPLKQTTRSDQQHEEEEEEEEITPSEPLKRTRSGQQQEEEDITPSKPLKRTRSGR